MGVSIFRKTLLNRENKNTPYRNKPFNRIEKLHERAAFILSMAGFSSRELSRILLPDKGKTRQPDRTIRDWIKRGYKEYETEFRPDRLSNKEGF